MKNIDYGMILTIIGVIIGVIGLFVGGKKIIMKISTKTRDGNIDMSNSNYTMEKHIYNSKKENSKEE